MSEEQTEQPADKQKEQGTKAPKKKLRLRVPEWSIKRGAIFAATLIVIFGGLIVASYFLDPNYGKSDEIIIGDTTITKQDIDTYVKQYLEIRDRDPSTTLKDENGKLVDVRKLALDAIVANAAYKYEAKKLGINPKGKDLAQGLDPETLESNLKVYSRKIDTENRAYEAVLAEKLLVKKDLLVMSIIFDTPYFNRAPQDKIQGYYDAAKKRLETEVAPVIKSNATKEEVAKKADTVWFDADKTDDKDWEQYFNRAVLTADIKDNYQDGLSSFNDIETVGYIRGNVGKLYDTDDKVVTLKNIGDTTDVFASKAGAFMVIRLEKKSDGKYNSWDDMLARYKKQYVTDKTTVAAQVNKNITKLSRTLVKYVKAGANMTAKLVDLIGSEKAYAIDPRCSDHTVTFVLVAYNRATNKYLSDAKITHTRATHGCNTYPNQYTGTHPLVSGSNQNKFFDNCLGPEPTWGGIDHPPGYTNDQYVRVQWAESKADGTRPDLSAYSASQIGWPDWTSAKINQSRNQKIYIMLLYDKNITGDWKLDTSSYVNTFNESEMPHEDFTWWEKEGIVDARPGQTVYFIHSVMNTGVEPSANFDRWRESATFNPDGTIQGGWSGHEGEVAVSGLDQGLSNIIYTPQSVSGGGYQRAFVVPSAPLGTLYCQRYVTSKTAKGNAADNPSEKACVRVSYWDINVNSQTDSSIPDVVEIGKTVNFTHTLTNTGNDIIFHPNFFGGEYVKNWVKFNYNRNNLAAPNYAGMQDDTEGCMYYSNFIGPGGVMAYGDPALANSSYCLGYSTPPVGQSINIPSDNSYLGRSYCQSYKVLPKSTTNLNVGTESTPACTHVVGGKTGVGVTAASEYIEPTDTAAFNLSIVTTGYTTHGTYPGYDITCSYKIEATAPNGAITPLVPSAECNESITSNTPITTNRTSATTAATPLGSKICLTVTDFAAANGNTALLADPSNPKPPPACVDVVAKPYFKVVGSDVAAGQAFGSCSTPADIVSWYKGSGGIAGAGAQFAVFASGAIRGFTGAQYLTTGVDYPAKPYGLNFTNSGSLSGNLYGGDFTGTCSSKNYFTPDDTLPWTSMSEVTVADKSAKFHATGPVTLSGTQQIELGNNTTLYVDGNLIIKDKITAKTGANSVLRAPLFTVIVKGNIYIDDSVEQLYGTYVAQPSGSNTGNIYTCAENAIPYNPMNASGSNAAYTTCNKRLLVLGSFVAQKVHLLRTNGSQYKDTGSFAAGRDNAAELFWYNPLIWMRSSIEPIEGGGVPPAQSITSLPPVL